MPQPVLVIHGIAMRDEQKVIGDVERLNDMVGGEQYRFIPAYWGDLGASDEHLDKLVGRYGPRSRNMWNMVMDRAARPITSGLGRTRAWLMRRRGDRELAARIKELSRQNAQELRSRARGYVNDKFQDARLSLTAALLPFVADVIVYQSHDYRQKIHQRIREVIARELPDHGSAERPVNILAHSLGGIIAFDMAMHGDHPLHVDHFITFGSQPAFFHVLDPRPGTAPAFDGQPVTLPPTIRRWTNIWDHYDLLAFGVSEVFRLHDGSAPQEVPVKCFKTMVKGAAFLQGHLGYWHRQPAADAIRAALNG